MSRVTLTSAALQYVSGHGKNVMVIRGYRSGCCGGRARVLTVGLGVPENVAEYDKVQVEDCVCWLPVDLEVKYIEIDFVKFWIFKKLIVKTSNA